MGEEEETDCISLKVQSTEKRGAVNIKVYAFYIFFLFLFRVIIFDLGPILELK